MSSLPKIKIHEKAPIDAAIWVTKIAIEAVWSAAKAEPPLNPNHPTHNIDAPTIVSTGLWGGTIVLEPKVLLLPKTRATTKAARPAVV